jgi:hypothetical protein
MVLTQTMEVYAVATVLYMLYTLWPGCLRPNAVSGLRMFSVSASLSQRNVSASLLSQRNVSHH